MSAIESSRGQDALAGLTLHAVLLAEKRQAAAAQVNRTLLDIIRDEEPNGSLFGHNKDRKSWKALCDRLRLKRAASDVNPSSNNRNGFNNTTNNPPRSLGSVHSPVRFTAISSNAIDSIQVSNPGLVTASSPPQSNQRGSTPFGLLVPIQLEPADNLMNVEHEAEEGADQHQEVAAPEGTRCLATVLAEERALSAREAEGRERTEVGVGESPAAEDETQPVRMSLMDLLEETDRQVGMEGYMNTVLGGNDGDGERGTFGIDLEVDAGVEEEEEPSGGGGENKCCVCMVRKKGAAFIPCGHTFCRLCSRELWVQRGHCAVCNASILEILDIF